MIGIIDYGMGNLHSVQKGFERVGADVKIVNDADGLAKADKLVLPGVGAIADAIATLHEKELVEPIRAAVNEGKWFLGICLGLQLLFEKSYEGGEHEGLGIVPGEVVKFDFSDRPDAQSLKIPHMGWNQLRWDRPAPFLKGLEQGGYVYFVHSYYVVPSDPAVIATQTEHGYPFTSSIWRDNVMATQFHPEKSQRVGLTMLKNFAEL